MPAWKLSVIGWRDGLVGELELTATRKCGRVEHFTVRQFPAGWRCNATNVPKSVVADALRWARQSGL